VGLLLRPSRRMDGVMVVCARGGVWWLTGGDSVEVELAMSDGEASE